MLLSVVRRGSPLKELGPQAHQADRAKKAKIAVARKLATICIAFGPTERSSTGKGGSMTKTITPFRPRRIVSSLPGRWCR